jgi:hypothetical protein
LTAPFTLVLRIKQGSRYGQLALIFLLVISCDFGNVLIVDRPDSLNVSIVGHDFVSHQLTQAAEIRLTAELF